MGGDHGMTTRPVIERPELPATGSRPTRDPRTVKRLATFGSVLVVLLGLLIVRLWFLQVVGAGDLEAQAVGNSIRTINIPAQRGDILDRNGVKLATTRAAWDVVALPQDLLNADGKTLSDTGKQTLARIARIVGEKPAVLQRKIITGNKRAQFKSVVLSADISDDLRLPLTEKLAQYPGIRLERTFRRTYPRPEYLSHVLGFVGPITEGQLEEKRRQGYRNDAIIGQDGLESRMETFLKGTDGERKVEVDASGLPVGKGAVAESPSKPGLTVQTTIDIKVQEALENALRVQVLNRSAAGGGGVVLDAKTGEVIAMGSYPPSTVPIKNKEGQVRGVTKKDKDLWRRRTYNRALNAVAPGSTFKPVTALTALNAGLLQPGEYLSSPKVITYDGTPFRNFRNLKLDDMPVRQALAMSSDTFFYQVAWRMWKATSKDDKRLGNTRLYDWARELGFGQPTGIDLPYDQAGNLPNRQWKRDNGIAKFDSDGNSWRSGDTINMSVGQGFLTASPLQMARAYASLVTTNAQGEHTLLQPFIAKEVVDPLTKSQKTDFSEARNQTILRPINPGVLETIMGGMRDVTSTGNGTAWSVFSRVGGLVAGKTGTAQTTENRADHAWFVGYGPPSDPKYVVAVMIEYSGLGAQVAAPAACQTMAAAMGYDPKRCGNGAPTRVSLD